MRAIKIIVLSIFSVALISCGGKEEKKKEGFSYEKKSEISKTVESNPNDVIITGNDAMQFNKKEIKVKAGEKVKITLKHIGKMDINVMGHNIVILKQGVNVTVFAGKAATSKATDYIPEGSEDDIIAYTDLIGGGQTTSIEFDAPTVGTYDFICSFPGHYALMKGKFIVE